MIRKIFLPLLAALGMAFAIYTVVRGNRPTAAAPAVAEPAQTPFKDYVAGAGIVETLSENIQVGTIVPGVVKEIYVKVGDSVKKGQPLWLIDDSDLQADLEVKEAAVLSKQSLLASAQAKYSRLKQQPRPEEVPPYQARVDEDTHSLEDAQDQMKLMDLIADKRAISQDDYDQRKHAVEVAEAKLRESTANLALLKAGTWDQDLLVAQADIGSADADVKAAEAQVKSDKDLIKRLTVTAPVDGQILQVKMHLGEYAPAAAGELATPLILMGDVKKLVVRTDVDENDAWRVPRDPATRLRAVANIRGNRDIAADLTFYRIEPFVIPKVSLTGDSTERVDTRVLQVLYTFDAGTKPIYVGQQMDVYIEAAPVPAEPTTTK